jgi:hypothetical protein
MTDVVRQLKIKSGSVGRLKKELGLYQEEEAKEQQKVSRLKAEGADEHDIKHAVCPPSFHVNLLLPIFGQLISRLTEHQDIKLARCIYPRSLLRG